MFLLLSIYILKFATDVLGMSAAVMGRILLLGRGLDAFVAPIVAYLSDRTKAKMGRHMEKADVVGSLNGQTFTFSWDPAAQPSHFPQDEAASLSIDVLGQYNHVATSPPIAPAYKADLRVTLSTNGPWRKDDLRRHL